MKTNQYLNSSKKGKPSKKTAKSPKRSKIQDKKKTEQLPELGLGSWIDDTITNVGEATGLKGAADWAGDRVGKKVRNGVKNVAQGTTDVVGDWTTFTADTAMGVVGAGDVIQKDAYETGVGKVAGDISSKYIAPVAGTIAASAVAGPAGGMAMQGVQKGVGSVAPNEAEQEAQTQQKEIVEQQEQQNLMAQKNFELNNNTSNNSQALFEKGGELPPKRDFTFEPTEELKREKLYGLDNDKYNYVANTIGLDKVNLFNNYTPEEVKNSVINRGTKENPEYYSTIDPGNSGLSEAYFNGKDSDYIPEENIKNINNAIDPDRDFINSEQLKLLLNKKANGGNLNKQDNGNGLPVVNNYMGQSHNGPNQGIPVDAQGNPSVKTGNKPVALTENGEVNFQGYIFSDELEIED